MKLKKFKKRYLILALLVIVSAVGFAFARKNPKVEYITVKAETGKLIQTVSETGTVKTAKEINLKFLTNGKIAKLPVKIGDKVSKDQILAELDYTNLLIQQRQSQANLESAMANLTKTQNGATSQDVAISKASADQAYVVYANSLKDLDNVEKSIAESIAQAEKTLNDLLSGSGSTITVQKQAIDTAQNNLNNIKNTYQQSINNKKESLLTTLQDKLITADTALDAVNRVLTDENLKDTLGAQNTTLLANVKDSYANALDQQDQASAAYSLAKANQSDALINASLDQTRSLLEKTLLCLNQAFGVLQKTVTGTKLNQTQLDAFKNSINSQITITSGAIISIQSGQQAWNDSILAYTTNVSNAEKTLEQAQANYSSALLNARNGLTNTKLSAEQQLTSAKARVDANYNAWQVAKAQLNKTSASPRIEDIRLAQAQVTQAQAALDSVRHQVANSIIRSPINGQITKVNYEIGEEPSGAASVISVLTEDDFEIEIDISESDITKVKATDDASITFDAFGDEIKFNGKVMFIEPAQTVIQDVVYYKTTIGDIMSPSAIQAPIVTLTSNASSTISTSTKIVNDSYGRQIKPGMTANVVITTAKKENVLFVPSRAIIENEQNKKIVKILQNGKPIEVPVTVGLKGDDGLTEIISGINAGDLVITSTKTAK